MNKSQHHIFKVEDKGGTNMAIQIYVISKEDHQ